MHVGRPLLFWCVLIVVLPWMTQGAAPPSSIARIRHPVDAALLADGQTLCVANQRSGTISLVDLSRRRVVGEVRIGDQLSALAVLPDGKHLLAADDARHQLVALRFDGELTVQARLAVSPHPVSIAVQPDGQRATVASLWSRRLDVVDSSLREGILRIIRLPFALRQQLVLPGGKVVVADAFGGRLAVVDVATGRVSTHELTGHNIRGLALSADGKQLIVAHQIIDQKTATSRENLQRGSLMSNVLRLLPLDQLDSEGQVIRLGTIGAGAGDPAGVAVVNGQLAVALAGVNEVAFVKGKSSKRVAVGRRPTVMVGTKKQLVVVNTFDDSVSLLDPARGAVVSTIRLGVQPELTYRDRGELLFYDARLSRDGWMSCHSCHTDGHTNGLLADTKGDGSFGTPKRTLTLLNTGLTDPWGWDGKEKYLHDQVRKSLAETMHGTFTEEQVGELTTFLNSLPPPPPLLPVSKDGTDRDQVLRGQRLFEDKGCIRCHIPPLTYSSGGSHDVGFGDEKGPRAFNPPSLRGVGQGYRFLHDNRASSLEEVFTKHRHKVGASMSRSDIDDLVRFLRSL